MNKLYYIGMLAVLAGACQKAEDTTGEPSGKEVREITVNSTLTKTTIDYEGDISHLVWTEGDNVMYLTDDSEGLYDYGFQKAAVKDNKFTANISKKAGKENKLLVVWPSKELAMGSSDYRFWMDESVTVSSKDGFDGKTLPMVALTDVPEGSEVNVSYRPLAAVLRVSIDTTGHSSEKLTSVTLTTAENCIGSYFFSTSEKDGASFKGSDKTLTVKVSDTPALKDFKYIYMVVNKAAYTGVKMEIETDGGKYSFEDGTMDLSATDRNLFRINITLPEKTTPAEECFVKVTEQSDITAGGRYLILSPKSASSYYVPSSQSGDDYMKSATLECREDGTIAKTSDTEKYAITFTTDASHEGKFALRYDPLGKYPYIGAPTNVSAGVDYIGVFWFGEESELSGYSNYWWTITVTSEKATIGSHEFKLWGDPTGRYGQLSFFKDGSKFGVSAPETDTDAYQDIVIFKLK